MAEPELGLQLEPIAEQILREFGKQIDAGKRLADAAVTDADIHAFSLAVSAKRIADALEKLAAPPEMVTTSVDADDWAAKEKAREDRDERLVAALEKLADCTVPVANGSQLNIGANCDVRQV